MTQSVVVDARPQRAVNLPALTGLRIVGAVWVVLFHFQTTLYEALPGAHFLRPVISQGTSGIWLFFVLSGFVIWHNYGVRSTLTPRASASFLWRRFARLWPVNLLTQVAALIIVSINVKHYGNWGAPVPDWYSTVGWLKSVFMVHEVDKGQLVYSWNQPAWSLTAEMCAYLVFLLLLAALLATGRTRCRSHFLWLLPALLFAYGSLALPGSFAYSWLARLIALFVCGVCLRLVGNPSPRTVPLVAKMQVVVPALIVGACYAGHTDWLGVLLALWVYSLSLDRGLGVRFFSTPAAQMAGSASYSLYMVHWCVFALGALLLHEVPALRQVLALYAIGCLTVAALASWALWRWYETPSRRLLNRLFDRVWPPPKPAPSASSPASGPLPHARRAVDALIP